MAKQYGSGAPQTRRRRPLEDRFWEKVEKTATCWNWTAAQSGNGYGRIGLGGKGAGNEYAHRVSYIWAKGPIPEGKEIDHLCRNRACVNPDHLEAVPHRINTLRGAAPNVALYLARMCKNGHAITEENTRRLNVSGRLPVEWCKLCRAQAASRWHKRQGKRFRGLPCEDNKGERNGMARLDDAAVVEILRLYGEGVPQAEIADHFGIRPATVGHITAGRSWKHVPRPEGFVTHRPPITAKLDEDKVAEILRLVMEGGVQQKEIAQRFGVDKSVISHIVSGDIWKHVPRPEGFENRRR